MIDPRRRPRVEDGFRRVYKYDIFMSNRRRDAMIREVEASVPFEEGVEMANNGVFQRANRIRVRAIDLTHWPNNPMGWVLNARRLTGEVIWIPLRIIRKIFYLDLF